MTDDELKEAARLHSAGATVRHKSRFHDLKSYQNETEIDQAFRNKWINPFYMRLRRPNADILNRFIGLKPEITDDIILKNLGDFNWRSRSTGAFFAAIKRKTEFTDIIGIHLLKSEVCYAGAIYARVLAFFNTEKGNAYLYQYLDYYLKQPQLYFDQHTVMVAVKYLDKINETNYLENYIEDWKTFIQNKPNWNKEIIIDRFEEKIDIFKTISQL